MRLRWIAAAVLALAVLACLPAGAGAKVGHEVRREWQPPVKQLIRFELEGSNGYSILVVSDRSQRLMVKASNEEFVTEYWTPDTLASPDRVKAKLPGLGTISVRFHPRGRVRHPSPPGCGGRLPTVQPGVVRGTIEFTGEREYTAVDAHVAEAETEEPTSWSCSYAPHEAPFVPARADWTSKLAAGAQGYEFLARKYDPGVIEGGEVLYQAETGELITTHPRFVIYRSTMIAAPASTFRDAHPEHTTLSPPPPFAGTGTLARTPASVFTWRGDLTVQFPGVDPMPMAGRHFEVEYCLRGEGCIKQHFAPF